jgi:hypothetical protein
LLQVRSQSNLPRSGKQKQSDSCFIFENIMNMKATTVVCLLLAAALCAAAVQTSETEYTEDLSPKELSEIAQAAEAQHLSGAEEPTSELENTEAVQEDAAAKQRKVVINVWRRHGRYFRHHSKRIHHNGRQIERLSKKILDSDVFKGYKALLHQIHTLAHDSEKRIKSLEDKISQLKHGVDGKHGLEGPKGPQGAPGKDGKDGKEGPQGAPGKDGKEGKAVETSYIHHEIAKAVKELNAKMDAVAKTAHAENAVALKEISSMGVKLGNHIQSVAKDLHTKVQEAESSTKKLVASTRSELQQEIEKVRKMPGPQGAPGKDGKDGAAGAAGAKGDTGARGPQGAEGPRGPAGPQGARGTDFDLGLIDICGVTGGDDRSCSRNPGQGYAYSVGDPHYRTWDGAQFDIHPNTYWGEIVLVQHKRLKAGDIEVQTATVPWYQNSHDESTRGDGRAKGNTAIAIAAWGNVIVFYARSGLNHYFLNGKQVNWPNHGMTKISEGIECSKSGGNYDFRIDNGLGSLRIWGSLQGGNNMDIHGHATGTWATGKSLTGAWGDWNGNAGNDQGIVNELNAQGKLSVLGTPRSYFKNKEPRTSKDGQFMLAFDMELDESQNRVIPGEQITIDIEEPSKKCPEKAEIVEQNCKGVVGGALLACSGDICLGVDPKQAGISAHEAQVQTHQKKLLPQTTATQDGDTCMLLDQVKEFGDLPKSGGKSFSLSMFIKQEGEKLEGAIAKKGTEWTLESNDAGDVIFTSNGKSCKAAKTLGRTYKNVIAVSSSTDRKIKIFVDGQQACSVDVTDEFTEPTDAPVQLGSIRSHINVKIAKPVYIASGIRDSETGLFSDKKPKCIGA